MINYLLQLNTSHMPKPIAFVNNTLQSNLYITIIA